MLSGVQVPGLGPLSRVQYWPCPEHSQQVGGTGVRPPRCGLQGERFSAWRRTSITVESQEYSCLGCGR